MANELPPNQQQQQARLQQLQQNIVTLQQQKNVAQEGLEEVKNALKELEGNPEGTVYKQVGQILIKTDPKTLSEELNEKERNLQSYLKRIDMQYEKQMKKFKELSSDSKDIRIAG